MANSLLKLTVDSSEYDAKLKKAAEGIRHLADRAHESAGELTGLEKSELDFIKALGEMETKSRSAAGKVRELESTYKELKVVYDQLNDAEKADEGGKALAASLDQLKQRAQDARKSLDDANKSLKGNEESAKEDGTSISDLTSKLGINIKSLVGWGAALGAGKVALDVLKDAFFNNEQLLDDWGRTCETSESLYKGFLNTLNTGDISGYLENIERIAESARDAYDALDALNTYNAFNQINIEKTRTGFTEAIADYRGKKGTKEDVKAAADALKKELSDRQEKEQEAYVRAIYKLAAERGVPALNLEQALSGNYGTYEELKKVMPTGTKLKVSSYSVGSPFGNVSKEYFPQTNEEKMGAALRALNDTELQNLQALGAQAQRTATEIAQIDKQLTRVLNAKVGGGSGGGNGGKTERIFAVGSIGAYEKEITDLRKAQKDVTTNEEWEALQHQIGKLTIKVKELKGELKTVPASISDGINAATDAQNKKIEDRLNDPSVVSNGMANIVKQIERDQKKEDTKEKKSLAEGLGQLGSGLGGIQSGFQQLGIDLGSGFNDVVSGLQGISSILMAIQTIVGAIEVISGADALIPFAGGGIIRAAGGTIVGNSYSGDNLRGIGPGGQIYGLNADEMVLNRFQQQALAGTLENGGMKDISISGHLEGETIALSVDRWGKRSGRGELAFWKNQ